MTPSCAHPDRPYHAKGRCHQCYHSWRRSLAKRAIRATWKRKCTVCSRTFTATRRGGKYCSEPCLRHAFRQRQSARLGMSRDAYEPFHNEELATKFILALRGRGYRKVGMRAARVNAGKRGPYYSAKRVQHSQGVLCVVRYWPEVEEGE